MQGTAQFFRVVKLSRRPTSEGATVRAYTVPKNQDRNLRATSSYERAIADLSESVRLDPRDHQSLNARAWIWANGPDAKLRDGPRAVSSASRACDLAGWRNPSYLTTLAAAYAEMGDFAAAVQWQERSLLLQDNDDDRRRGLQRLDLYKASKTDRMPPKD
jgi:tetratricopeptide (TPR) repeat protein